MPFCLIPWQIPMCKPRGEKMPSGKWNAALVGPGVRSGPGRYNEDIIMLRIRLKRAVTV
jgi:hypothetical protein